MRISDWSSDVCSSDLLLTEIGIGVVDRDDLARLGGVEQAHRAPCEDSAIALQIRGPGAVRYLVRERLGDVDRVRVERLDQQRGAARSEEHTSELQSLMRISYAVFCLKKKNKTKIYTTINS